jgi:hypothetical protein
MEVHLRTFFPERCAELGEDGVRGAVAYALARAAQYDITSERDVCKFLNLMFVYGFSFDVDPELPWAAAILNDAQLNRSSVKMYLLMKAAAGTLEPPSLPEPEPTEAEIEAGLKAAAKAEAEALARAEAAARQSREETGGDDGKPQR